MPWSKHPGPQAGNRQRMADRDDPVRLVEDEQARLRVEAQITEDPLDRPHLGVDYAAPTGTVILPTLCVLLGIQFILMGLLGEMIAHRLPIHGIGAPFALADQNRPRRPIDRDQGESGARCSSHATD